MTTQSVWSPILLSFPTPSDLTSSSNVRTRGSLGPDVTAGGMTAPELPRASLRKSRLFHEYLVAPSTNMLSRPPPFSTNILSRRHEYVVAHPAANSLSQRHFHGALYSLYHLPSESP